MKFHLFTLIVCTILSFQKINAESFQKFDKTAYYQVLKSGTFEEIIDKLNTINNFDFPEKNAYEGTLLMKKAGLLQKPKDKLEVFKKGRIELETEIGKNNSNVEYRFLRLIITEHAPKVTKYRANINDDADYIVKNFKNLSPDVQAIVIDYAKTSPSLKALNFQP